jgi:low temperature requirement protein LtrA
LRAGGPQSVTFVELFFDLVFVFAVTQVTALVASDLTPEGLVRSLVIFWLIWWAWTQFTWTLNPADTTHGGVRLVTLAATGTAFAMATAVPGAFTGDGLWFAIPYVVVRLLGLGLQVQIELERSGTDHRGAWRWVGGSLLGLALVVAGGLADPGVRPALWLAAIAVDMLAAALAGRGQVWELDAAHFAERHGLFVIIAIGESLIVAGTGLAEEVRSMSLLAVGGATVLLAATMWWSYFGWLKDALEHAFARAAPVRRGPLARDAYSLGHFPLVCGIVGFAVTTKDVLHHPETPLTAEALGTLVLGVLLFSCSAAAAYWRLTGQVLAARLVISAVMVAAIVAVAHLAPLWPLLVASAALLAIILAESKRRPAESHLEHQPVATAARDAGV